MKNVKFRGKKRRIPRIKRRNSAVKFRGSNSAVKKPKIPRNFPRNPRETVGPTYDTLWLFLWYCGILMLVLPYLCGTLIIWWFFLWYFYDCLRVYLKLYCCRGILTFL